MKYLIPSLLLLFFLLFPVLTEAQQRGASQRGTTYESLLQRSDQPNSYISHVVLPKPDGSSHISVLFRLDYDLVPFLRVRRDDPSAPQNAEYFAPFHMGLEIFEGRHQSSRRNSSSGTSVFRDSYQDTIYVNTFDETRSRLQHIQGYISSELEPGEFNYELQLRRAQSTREQSSTRRNLNIPQYDTLSNAGMVLMSEFNQDELSATGTFLNYGQNVLYGDNYQILTVLPDTPENSQYSLSVFKMRSGTSDEAEAEPVYETSINADQIFRTSEFQITKTGSDISLSISKADEGARYGVFSVPNSEFENARYRLQIKNSEDKILAQQTVNSRWLDMPVSLLNIDVAINMLKFIVSDEELDRLKSGSTVEKEREFREFWDKRDPTPEIEYNELMAEYYNRIDYAYRNFSSLQTPGYESDMGKAYILYGEPQDVDRRLPTDQPTREIWEYPNRTLVFEATSGFGDFRLISER